MAARRLRSLRWQGGLTLERLAAVVEDDVATVALWEQGAPIPASAQERLAALFDVLPSWLQDEED